MSCCQAYKHAEVEVSEAMLTIETIWRTMKMQIEILREHWSDLPGDLQVHGNSLLMVLQTKIQLAIVEIESLLKPPRSDDGPRAKEEHIVVEEMEKWQARFDRSWFMIAMVHSPALDRSIAQNAASLNPLVKQMGNLRRAATVAEPDDSAVIPSTNVASVFIDAEKISFVEAIRYSEAVLAVRNRADGQQEHVLVDNAPRSMSKRDVRNLARKFADMDPLIVHLLACEGLVEGNGDHGQQPRFQFVFKFLPGFSQPQSLRTALMTPCSTYSLSERIDLAVSLARSLIFLHESHFVHKNIRPETIVLLADDNSTKDRLGKPSPIGFEELRSEDSYTSLGGDDVAERNLYRHPHRQGLVAQESYNVCHDIYSLGVCLLEIGLWTSFVCHSDAEGRES